MVPFLTSLPRRVLLPMLLAAGALSAGAAQAGGVQWSIGIQLPPPPVVYYPAPPQRVYAPAPVYVQPAPRVIYVEPQRPWPRHSHRHQRHWRDDDYRDDYRDGHRGRGGDDRWQDRGGDWRHGR